MVGLDGGVHGQELHDGGDDGQPRGPVAEEGADVVLGRELGHGDEVLAAEHARVQHRVEPVDVEEGEYAEQRVLNVTCNSSVGQFPRTSLRELLLADFNCTAAHLWCTAQSGSRGAGFGPGC